MPVLPPLIAQPYDTVNAVLNGARTRLNDELTTLHPVSGKLLQNNQVFTQQLVNTAWRKLQEFLANLGYTKFRQEAIVYGIPAVSSLDPLIQVRIDWFNYFDGANLFNAPVLPPDLIIPLKVWERQSGMAGAFVPMELIFDGLPNWNKQSRNGLWEWRAEAIYMPGALCVTDLRLRYEAFMPDFVDSSTTQWYQQPVPLLRCHDALSLYICAEIAEGRDDMDAAKWTQKAEAAAKIILNRDMAMKQRGNIRRQSRSGRLEGRGGRDFGLCY